MSVDSALSDKILSFVDKTKASAATTTTTLHVSWNSMGISQFTTLLQGDLSKWETVKGPFAAFSLERYAKVKDPRNGLSPDAVVDQRIYAHNLVKLVQSLQGTLSKELFQSASQTWCYIREAGPADMKGIYEDDSMMGTMDSAPMSRRRLKTSVLQLDGADITYDEHARPLRPPPLPPVPAGPTVPLRFTNPGPASVGPTPSGCFAPGTLVWAGTGQVPIESLKQNDFILTRASTQEWGKKSDEVVAMPTGGHVELWGFNNEKPFFTANHVFFTTTGLRAISPEGAKEENPWLDVGNLREGHTIYYTEDGSTYQFVTIENLCSAVVDCDHVWGIHLREGLRSYHANGYLVHLNYPEITIKSIADILRKLPSDQLVTMLSAIRELRPVFERFGGGLVEDLLARELADDQFLATARPKLPDTFAPPPLYFQSRSYDLAALSDPSVQAVDGWSVPDVDCVDGLLYVGGDFCARGQIIERGFAWSRPISDDLWEHGLCSFGEDRTQMLGDGLVWIEADPNPITPKATFTRFEARSLELREQFREPVWEGDMLFGQQAMSSSLTQTQEAPPEPTTEFERMLASDQDFSFAFANQATQDQLEKDAEILDGRNPIEEPNVARTLVDTFDVSYDPANYEETFSTDATKKLFKIALVSEGSKEDAKTYRFIIPQLDQLAEERKSVASLPEAPQYYESDTFLSANNQFDAKITFQSWAALALAADDNIDVDNKSPKSFINLTFQRSSSDLRFDFMPRAMTLNVNMTVGEIKGKMCEFDSGSDDHYGIQHYIVGPRIKGTPAPAVLSGDGKKTTTPPAPATNPSSSRSLLLSADNLTSGLGVNSDLLKSDAQRLIFDTMVYHMDTADRELFTRSARPEVSKDPTIVGAIPPDLANELDPKIGTWLRTTYATAFFCNNLSKQDEDIQRKFNATFDKGHIKQLNYFWTGKGRNCLSQSEEYKRLNAVATTIAFRRRVPQIIPYLDDLEYEDVKNENGERFRLNGGCKWAYKLYHSYMKERWIRTLASRIGVSDITKYNPLEPACTVLAALWPGKWEVTDPKLAKSGSELGELVASAVKRHYSQKQMFDYQIFASVDFMENGLRDNFGTLLDIILDPIKATNAGMDLKMREALMDDIATIEETLKNWRQMTAAQAKEKAMAAAASSIKKAANGTTSAISGGVGAYRGIGKFMNWIRGNAPKPQLAIANQPGSTQLKWSAGIGLVLTLAATALFALATFESWGHFSELNTLDRAALVTSTLQAAGGFAFSLHQSLSTWKLGKIAAIGEKDVVLSTRTEKLISRRHSCMNPTNKVDVLEPVPLRRRAISAPPALKKPTSIHNANVPKPSRIDKWVTNFKDQWKINRTATALRIFGVLLSAVMLIISCLQAARNWGSLTTAEKVLTVIGLVLQVASLILELAALFMAVSPWLTVGLVLVGIVVSVIALFVSKKDPPPSPAQTWWANKGKAFMASLDPPPKTKFSWSLETQSGAPGKDMTVTVVGKPRLTGGEELTKRVKRVSLAFLCGSGNSATLFAAPSFGEKPPGSASLGLNQASIAYPFTLAPFTLAGLTENTTGGSTAIKYEAAVALDPKRNPPQARFIDLTAGGEIRFDLRGIIAIAAPKPADAIIGNPVLVPEWLKHTLRIVEQYSDDTGLVEVEMLEEELDFKKQ